MKLENLPNNVLRKIAGMSGKNVGRLNVALVGSPHARRVIKNQKNAALKKIGINAYIKTLLSGKPSNIPNTYEANIHLLVNTGPLAQRYINKIKMYKGNIRPNDREYQRILRGYLEHMEKTLRNLRHNERAITIYFPNEIYSNPPTLNKYIKSIMNTKILRASPSKRIHIINLLKNGKINEAYRAYYAREPRSRN